MRILITGANGHLGRKLIRRLMDEGSDEIVAMVRSERAAQAIRNDGLAPIIKIVDYTDPAGISEASKGCDKIVHLAGIIKESEDNKFQKAHEHTCEALVAAKPAAEVIVCLGIIGTSAASRNKCFASRAAAEAILAAGEVPTIFLRVPMVLGEDDYASRSLAKAGQSTFAFTFRATSLEQPIYSDDVINALIRALALEPIPEPKERVLELAGPETVTRAELFKRAGHVFKKNPKVISVPIFLGYLIAFVLEIVSRNPPVTRAMLGVLDHDDHVDNQIACKTLGLSLTSLDEALNKVLGGRK